MTPFDALNMFMSQLPPPIAFQESNFNVEELMSLILRSNFPSQVGMVPQQQQQQQISYQRDDGYGQKRKYPDDDMGGQYGRDQYAGRRQFN